MAIAALFAALIAFVSVAHAAMHDSSGDAVPCAVCDSPADQAPPAVAALRLDESRGGPQVRIERAPCVAPIDAPSARGPPRS